MVRIGIIGTAGRKDDGGRLTDRAFGLMLNEARRVLADLPRPHLGVSGGAAWADHVAVTLFLYGEIDHLTLHLPAPLRRLGGFDESHADGRIANHYHRAFSAEIRHDTLGDLADAFARGATATVSDGFHQRNLLVGRCDFLLAFTFGDGATPKDGGTRHAWDRSVAPRKVHVPLRDLLSRKQLSLL